MTPFTGFLYRVKIWTGDFNSLTLSDYMEAELEEVRPLFLSKNFSHFKFGCF